MGANDYHVLERGMEHVRGWNRRIDRIADRVPVRKLRSPSGDAFDASVPPLEAKRVSSYGGP